MTTFNVSNATALRTALKNADGGDKVVLAGGTYRDVVLSTAEMRYSSPVTITSAGSGNTAVLEDLLATGVRNITFDRVTFKDTFASPRAALITNSEDITIKNSRVVGTPHGGHGTGSGVRVSNSDDVTVTNTTFSALFRGTEFSNSDDVTFTSNSFSAMARDSMGLAGVSNVLIANNSFRNLKSDPGISHKDVIQFWTSHMEDGSRNVTIRGNYMESPDGMTHGIYVWNETGKVHRNIVIENNTVKTSHALGITVDDAIGVTIRGNTLIHNKSGGHDGGHNIPLINVSNSSKDVTIVNNKIAGNRDSIDGFFGNWGNASSGDADQDTGTGSAATGASDTFRFWGASIEGRKSDAIAGVNFADGDRLVFLGYDKDTFHDQKGGNAVLHNANGSYAVVDSAVDLAEIAACSPDVKAVAAANDTVVVTISQAEGTQVLMLRGLGAAFKSVEPELF